MTATCAQSNRTKADAEPQSFSVLPVVGGLSSKCHQSCMYCRRAHLFSHARHFAHRAGKRLASCLCSKTLGVSGHFGWLPCQVSSQQRDSTRELPATWPCRLHWESQTRGLSPVPRPRLTPGVAPAFESAAERVGRARPVRQWSARKSARAERDAGCEQRAWAAGRESGAPIAVHDARVVRERTRCLRRRARVGRSRECGGVGVATADAQHSHPEPWPMIRRDRTWRR